MRRNSGQFVTPVDRDMLENASKKRNAGAGRSDAHKKQRVAGGVAQQTALDGRICALTKDELAQSSSLLPGAKGSSK